MASFLGALSLSSCSGNAKNKEMTENNYTIANKIRKEELLLSIALSEYKQVIFDILTPTVESAKTVLPSVQKDKK